MSASAVVDEATINNAGSGQATADAQLEVTTEVEMDDGWAGASGSYAVSTTVVDPTGMVVASSEVTAPEFNDVDASIVSVSQEFDLTKASLWTAWTAAGDGEYVPQLWTVVTTVTDVSTSTIVDASNSTFGVRHTRWSADEGFFLNGQAVKLLGTANHQDFFGVGVAVPDSLQPYRMQRLSSFGINAWRCAHNAPNEALLEAADRLGMLVWDENHRNGQPDEMETLIRRGEFRA